MATRIAAANGNLTTAGTWQTADATSLLVSAAANTTLTTSYVTSATFTPGAITIDGIAVWVNTRLGSTGTMSVALDQAGVDVAGTPVTINVADIPSDGNCWVFFKFAAPVLLLGATLYSVKAKTSSATQVNLFRNATAGNWSRLLRTTTTGAPAAADLLYILGEKTGAGTGNTITVTMDDAAAGATVYGQIDISAGGLLTYGVTAATAYFLKIAGDMNVRAGGTLNMGTTGTPMPSDSSGILEFNCGSNVQFGLLVKAGGTFVGQGNPVTNVSAKLNADAAGGATSLTTDISTGWKNGDEIGIATTTRTVAECEKKSLTADAVTTTLTIAAIANAHSGTSPTQAELINLTRNVKIRGISTSFQTYVNISDGAAVDLDYVECLQMGSATANKRGFEILVAASGSCNINACSFHDFIVSSSFGLRITPGATIAVALSFTNNVSYNIHAAHFYIDTGTMGAGSITLSNHISILSVSNNAAHPMIRSAIAEMTVSQVTAVGCAGPQGIIIEPLSGILLNLTNLTAHGNATAGIQLTSDNDSTVSVDGNTSTVLSDWTAWRNGSSGIIFGDVAGSSVAILRGLKLTGTNTSFGNAAVNPSANFRFASIIINSEFHNLTANGEASFSSGNGISLANLSSGANLIGCKFFNASCGATTAHTSADLLIITGSIYIDTIFINANFASATEISGASLLLLGSRLGFQRLDQTSGNNKTIAYEGTTSLDTAIFDTSPSIRLTPSLATQKLVVTVLKRTVPNGGTVTVSVKVRCSVIGDGAAYNGNRPRLIQKAQPGAGTSADVVLDTATVASDGAFETLTGTIAAVTDECVIEFVVDSDGTGGGWVNVDTLSVT